VRHTEITLEVDMKSFKIQYVEGFGSKMKTVNVKARSKEAAIAGIVEKTGGGLFISIRALK
jgi:hypothetical protein